MAHQREHWPFHCILLSNMEKLKTLIITALFATQGLYAQGPLDGYMKGKGNLDLAPSFSYMHAPDFAGAGSAVYAEPYTGYMLSAFAEYGVTDRFDLVATVPYIITTGQKGFQDGGFYAKYQVLKAKAGQLGQIRLIGGVGASLPLSGYAPVATGALGQRAVVVPARAILQWDTKWGPFVNLTGGFNWRLDDYKDADLARVRDLRPEYNPTAPPGYSTWLVKIGLPAKNYYLDAWWELQHIPVDKGSNYVQGVVDLPQAYGVSYSQVGGTVYYSETGKRGVFLSGAKILNGRNVSRVFRLTGGFVVKL